MDTKYGKFNKLKTVMVDKPVFKMTDENNPVNYKLKPQGSSVVADQMQNQQETMESERQPSKIESPTTSTYDYASKQDVQSAVKDPYAQTPPPAPPAAAQRGFASDHDPELPYVPKMKDEKPDDDATVKMNVEDILTMGDTDDILDELDHMDEYEMSPRDRQIAADRVWDALHQQRAILTPGDDGYPVKPVYKKR